MSTSLSGGRRVATIIGAVLIVLALLAWAALMVNLANLRSSDAAGNGLAEAYAVGITIALWVLLALVMLAVAFGTGLHGWASAAAVILLPLSGAAALAGFSLVTARGGGGAMAWPGIVMVATPPIILAYAAWLLVPSWHTTSIAGLVAPATWIAVLALSLLPWWPLLSHQQARQAARMANQQRFAEQRAAQEEVKRQEFLAKLARFDSDTPLWDWLTLADPDSPVRAEALAAIRTLPRRQADAELMLDRGMGWPLLELPNLGLSATPALCAKATAVLMQRAADFRPKAATPPPYAIDAKTIEILWPAMQWLAKQGCDCGAALDAVADAVRAYPDSPARQRFLDELAGLR